MRTGPGWRPVVVEGSCSSASDAVVDARAARSGDHSATGRRLDLLQLPAGDRLDVLRSAKRRALARLKVAHRDEYEILVEAELANPSNGATS